MSDVKRRRDEYAEATQRAIVDAALEQFSVRGYLPTSLDDIASGARVTKGAIYHHFVNKQAVFEAVLVQVNERFVATVEEQIQRRSGDEDLLTVALNAYLDASVEPLFSRLALHEGPIALGWDRWRQVSQDHVVKSFADMVARQRGGGLSGADACDGLVLRALIGALHEMALSIAASPDPARAKEEAAALVTDLVASLRATGRIDRPG